MINKGLKIGLSIAVIGITGTIVYMLIKKMKKKKEEEIGSLPVSSTTPITPITTPVSTISIPFKSKVEGNAFRGWINDNYPSYASEIDLDRTGSYNNSYINKAWTKYGSVYQVSGGVIAANLKTDNNVEVNTKSALTNAYNILTGTTSLTAPTGNFNAATSANALYNSMKGGFTDEDLFFNTSNGMSESQRVLTRQYFDDNNIGQGDTLCQWIEGDFSGGQEDEALKLYGLPTDAGYFETNCD